MVHQSDFDAQRTVIEYHGKCLLMIEVEIGGIRGDYSLKNEHS